MLHLFAILQILHPGSVEKHDASSPQSLTRETTNAIANLQMSGDAIGRYSSLYRGVLALRTAILQLSCPLWRLSNPNSSCHQSFLAFCSLLHNMSATSGRHLLRVKYESKIYYHYSEHRIHLNRAQDAAGSRPHLSSILIFSLDFGFIHSELGQCHLVSILYSCALNFFFSS